MRQTMGRKANANLLQVGRINRCYRYVHRHNPDAALEAVAREWIHRYSERWRRRFRRTQRRRRGSDAVSKKRMQELNE